MNKSIVLAAAIIALGALSAPTGARADNGEIAAGVAGGLVGGLLLGGALAPRPVPPPVYVAPPEPVYLPQPYGCYWTYGQPYWDGYAWRRPRMRVCD